MSAQIITKDLGDGYYQHQINISTYYYCESIVSPVALRDSRVGKNSQATVKTNFGRFQQYRLSQYVNSGDLQIQRGEVVKLASVDKGKLTVNPEAIAIFNKYPNNEIAFVGNYGKRASGKSFWYDKILNLSDVNGNKYSENRRGPGLYFWSIPYTKDNLKFFLVDYAGFEGKDAISPDEEKLLDFELLLCEKMVIIPQPNDEELSVLRPAYTHLLQSQRRFSDKGIQANKFSSYWPNEIYTLYRSSRPVKKEIDNIGILFSVYNFSIIHDALDPSKSSNKEDLLKTNLINNSDPLNDKYVKMTSIVFQDIFDKMKGKQYGNVIFNGSNLPHILQKSTESINNGKGVKIDQIFDGVKGNIYDETVQKSKLIYLREVNPLRQDKNPKPFDVLTEAFERGNNKAFRSFDKEVIDPKRHEQYELKLQKEINKIEAEILQENKQRTYDYYNKKLPNDEQASPNQYFNKLKKSFKNEKNSTLLDHNDLLPVEERLEKSFIGGDEQIHLLPKSEQQRLKELKQLIDLKKKELEGVIINKSSILKGGKDPQTSELVDKHSVLISKTQILKKQLDDKKELNNNLTPEQRQMLLTTLRQVHKKNEDKLNQIKSNGLNDDEIKQIRDKIRKFSQKNSLIENGISNLDKTNLSNRSNRSVIRDIKTENIKKVTLK